MPEFTRSDHKFMARALRLAERGLFTTDPNPRVGCVIVGDSRVVGEGWHRRAGEAHAERVALEAAGRAARGATAYVTLEPCSHQGRTPPCAEALVEAGVARVIFALADPNPAVAGRGAGCLRAAGIDVASGLLWEPAEAINRGFLKRMRVGLPWVTVKLAMSLDGRTAMASGESRWITDAPARRDVHRLRARSSAVLTGVETVLADDPRLTARDVEGPLEPPRRFVFDSTLRTPPTAALVTDGGGVTLLCSRPAEGRAAALEARGAEVCTLPADAAGHIDPEPALRMLARLEMNEVMVESGPTLAGALVRAGLVDELVIYAAPHLMGGEGRPLLRLPGLGRMAERLSLSIVDLRMIGDDIRITARPVPPPQE